MAEQKEQVNGFQINSKRIIGYHYDGGRWHAVYFADTPDKGRYILVNSQGAKGYPARYSPSITQTTRPLRFPKNPWK